MYGYLCKTLIGYRGRPQGASAEREMCRLQAADAANPSAFALEYFGRRELAPWPPPAATHAALQKLIERERWGTEQQTQVTSDVWNHLKRTDRRVFSLVLVLGVES